jgi:hypothetical protein
MKVSSVGLGWRGTYAALLNEVRCFPYHGKKDASAVIEGLAWRRYFCYTLSFKTAIGDMNHYIYSLSLINYFILYEKQMEEFR